MKLKPVINSIVLLAVITLAACKENKPQLLLPVYGEKKTGNKDTIYHTVGAFEFTNQYGEKVSEQTVKNKIYVADFFFATCQSICPEMSKNLVDVQKAYENDDSLLILCHTVNPMHDTVEVLKNYAELYGAKKGKWHFLTGDKKKIYTLAMDGYLLNAVENDGTPEGFIHSELLMLVDPQGRIRGIYDGTDKAAVTKLISDIKVLKRES